MHQFMMPLVESFRAFKISKKGHLEEEWTCSKKDQLEATKSPLNGSQSSYSRRDGEKNLNKCLFIKMKLVNHCNNIVMCNEK